MPDHQNPGAASVSALAMWTVAACLGGTLWKGGGWSSASPLTTYLATHKTKKLKPTPLSVLQAMDGHGALVLDTIADLAGSQCLGD